MASRTLPTSASSQLPSLDEIREAQQLIYSLMQPTPQISWPLLNRLLGADVWVKHENHTPIGAFKARTAVVYAAELFRGPGKIKGLITATRGNHGQSVALAGKRFGVPVTIVVPFGNSVEKNEAMRAQGATLIEFGQDFRTLVSTQSHWRRSRDSIRFRPSIATSSKAWPVIGWNSSGQFPTSTAFTCRLAWGRVFAQPPQCETGWT